MCYMMALEGVTEVFASIAGRLSTIWTENRPTEAMDNEDLCLKDQSSLPILAFEEITGQLEVNRLSCSSYLTQWAIELALHVSRELYHKRIRALKIEIQNPITL